MSIYEDKVTRFIVYPEDEVPEIKLHNNFALYRSAEFALQILQKATRKRHKIETVLNPFVEKNNKKYIIPATVPIHVDVEVTATCLEEAVHKLENQRDCLFPDKIGSIHTIIGRPRPIWDWIEQKNNLTKNDEDYLEEI